MKPCKRLEIVIESALQNKMADRLVELGASGYSVIHPTAGVGDRGMRRDDEPMGTSSNSIFIVACETEELAEKIVAGVRPLLTRSGGICLVSDAQWVRH